MLSLKDVVAMSSFGFCQDLFLFANPGNFRDLVTWSLI